LSTLYIRLPSRSVADNAAHWIALPCPYALVSTNDTVEREGVAALPDLANVITVAQRVVLLLAASDVTLLHLAVPPMSSARLRVALPNLVEDQLMTDPADCVMVAGPVGNPADAPRTVAVVQRAWLEVLLQTVTGFGARQVAALPAQLCLEQAASGAAAVVTPFGQEIDLAMRLDEEDGLGLPLLPDDPAASATEVVQALCAIVPTVSIALYVPTEQVSAYERAVATLLPLDPRVTVFSDGWSHWIEGARSTSLNLVAGMAGAAGATVDWRRWRAPMVLATLLLLLNIGALNFEWWRLSREAAALRTSMVQAYKNAYPKETVIVDPAAQMRQKLAAARHDAGQPAPDDFAALAAGFALAWNGVTQNATGSAKPAIANMEYRDRSLFIKPKPEPEVPMAQMKSALAMRNLGLAQSAPGVWQIRSAP
jgi:general secretion pathway protein L